MGKVIESNVLGRLGRTFQTLAHTCEIEKYQRNNKKYIHTKGFEIPVPSVPTTETESKVCSVTTVTEAPTTVKKICAKCGKPGQRFCLGESHSGKYVYAHFCLECYPHHF